MKRILSCSSRRLLLLCASFCIVLLVAHSAGAVEMDDSINVKVLRVRAMAMRMNSANLAEDLPTTNEELLLASLKGTTSCGGVEIGNQYVNTSFGGDLEVIITGDVINAGNTCRE